LIESAPRGVGGFVLEGKPTPVRVLLADVWASRDLIRTLARKEFFVRYRRASFGILWAVGLPVFLAVVQTVVFSHLIRVRSGTAYAAYIYTGLVGWTFFSGVFGAGATAIVDNSTLASRIYFPRMDLIIVKVIAGLYTFWVSLLIMIVICLIFGVQLGPALVLLIPATILMTAVTLSFSLLSAGLHVYFRDIRFVVTAALSAWYFVTPVLYPLSVLPSRVQWVVQANPLTGVVELFRAATVGADAGYGLSVAISCVWVVVLTVGALFLYSRQERNFCDLL
jgi:lipopolysaccharide transport system permease protein